MCFNSKVLDKRSDIVWRLINICMKVILCSLLVFCIFCGFIVEHGKADRKPRIIFDTDMGPDFDDVGAITVLHALAAKGECEILATVSSDSHASVAPTIEIFNQYFGKPNIPIGIASAKAPGFIAHNNWNDSLVLHFLKKKPTEYPNALEVYRKVLARQEDNSVTIVTVGFTSNIAELLNSKPDKFSNLSGMDLVKKKVKNWVAMAGIIPNGVEFNVNEHKEAAYEAFSRWPKPILLSGFEIGDKILTGGKVAKQNISKNPAAWAYQYNLATYDKNLLSNRPSWDQTAVLCAVRNPEKYFYVNGPGKFIVNKDGSNRWDADINAGHYFLAHKYPYEKISTIIENLMLYEPGN